MRILLAAVGQHHEEMVGATVRTIFAQPDERQVAGRRYLSLGSMALIDATDQHDKPKEVNSSTPRQLPAAQPDGEG